MKAKELHGMDVKGLDEKLLELKKELVKLNAQVAVGTSIKNPGQVKKVKKTIARVLTIKQIKENAPQKAPAKDAKKEAKKSDSKKEGKQEVKKAKEVTKKQ